MGNRYIYKISKIDKYNEKKQPSKKSSCVVSELHLTLELDVVHHTEREGRISVAVPSHSGFIDQFGPIIPTKDVQLSGKLLETHKM